MNVLLIGGSGFIGNNVLQELRSQSIFDVWALEHSTPLPNDFPRTRIIKKGLRDLSLLDLKTINPDVIIHLGRPTFPKLRGLGRKLSAAKGKRWNSALIDNLQKLEKCPRLIYVSGSLMYGNSNDVLSEGAVLNPISYARDYSPLEEPIEDYLNSSESNGTLLRVPWVLGLGSWFHWIYKAHFKRHHSVPLFGKGDNKMHFILLSDLARTIAAIAQDSGIRGVRNLFSSRVLRQQEFAKLIAEELGCQQEKITGKYDSATKEALMSNIVLTSLYDDIEIEESDFNSELKRLLQDIK